MKSKQTFTVIFFTRKSRSNPNQLTIYARITVSGKRSEISLKRSIHFKDWDSHRSRARGSSSTSRALNAYLDEVFSKLLNCYKELLSEEALISSEAIKSRFLGEDNTSKTLRELITYHHDKMGMVLKPGTMKNYYTTEKYLYKFLQRKRRTKDIYLKQLNYELITDFEYYLRHYKNSKQELMMSNNGVMKHLERFKKILNLAVKLEWMPKNPFSQFKLKYNKYDRAYLTNRELKLLEGTEFKSQRLERVKDCFVFSCYTGLSYVDVKDLTLSNIVQGIDGRYWIYTKREKTNESVKVPLLPKALEIIEKYSGLNSAGFEDSLLPLSSNQKTNKYLKEIAGMCKIYKHMTFHVARHTFATTVMLSNGVPIETVSKLLGHSKLTTTQIYARIVETKISDDIDRLLERFKEKEMDKAINS
ncbi:site-specific integrase [Zhouia amylolytica]|uniref:Site-specific recombinase XerD n=1 Tax=Zhouia amylolytica AD3 TaxID=1286632 RepID=W2USV3_9FLAO|nr:site-specific integrase [Zhouia amylolytica]ETN97088.1 site-specific recombinase XerD [Zhouia amylolytica AD3]